MDLVTRMIMLIIFLIAGILCGMMFNIALGRKVFERGGIMGGIIVGVAMFAI